MTRFSSGRHEKLTADPRPYVRTYNGTDSWRVTRKYAAEKPARYENGFGEVVTTQRHPRPEFDRPLTNPPSRALDDAREYRSYRVQNGDGPEDWDRVVRMLHIAIGSGVYADHPDHDAMVLHAHRVLTRIANLTKKEN